MKYLSFLWKELNYLTFSEIRDVLNDRNAPHIFIGKEISLDLIKIKITGLDPYSSDMQVKILSTTVNLVADRTYNFRYCYNSLYDRKWVVETNLHDEEFFLYWQSGFGWKFDMNCGILTQVVKVIP